MERTTRLAPMAGKRRMSEYFVNRQVTLQMSLPVIRVFQKFLVQTSANVPHATGFEDRTTHRMHLKCRFFSCARHFGNAHALVKTALESAFLRKSSCRHMFHRNLLGAHLQFSPTSLVTETGTSCTGSWIGSCLGRLAEQSSITYSD